MDKQLNLSSYYLKPGFAYGGSCLPKDLKALTTIAHDYYLDCPVLENIEKSNEFQKEVTLNRIIEFNKRKIGFLGLSFKAGTDDLRNSPIVDIIERLLGKGFEIKIYDRNVQISKLYGANKEYILNRIPFISKFIIDNPVKLIQDSDLIVIVNHEKGFKKILEKTPDNKIIYDLININFQNKEKKANYVGISW